MKTCSCGVWQSTGIPCCHTISIILGLGKDPQLYAQEFYTLEFYRNTYINAIFHPLTHTGMDNRGIKRRRRRRRRAGGFQYTELMPANTRRPSGRPKKRRIHGEEEVDEEGNIRVRKIHHCSRCGDVGHSKRTCHKPI